MAANAPQNPLPTALPAANSSMIRETLRTLGLAVAIILGLLLLIYAVLNAQRGWAWALAEISGHVGSIGWLALLPLLVWFGLETIRAGRRSTADPAAGQRPGRLRRVGSLVGVAVVIAGNGCLNIAASRVDKFWQDRKPHTTELYVNHDLAKLVGQCVRLGMLRHAESIGDPSDRAALEALANIAPKQWAALVEANDLRAAALADGKLTDFLREPKARALHVDQWRALLVDWTKASPPPAPSAATLDATAETIAADFGITLREALKADFEKGGKAYAAMQLDVAQKLLNQTPVSLAKANPEINAALAEVKALMAEDAKALDALNTIISDVRQSQEAHAEAVERRFDEVIGRLMRIESKIDTGLTNDAIFAWIKLIETDNALSPEAKRQRMEPLLAQIINNQPANAPRLEVPAQIQDAVERTFAGASKVVRFAALARVGLDKEADELAAEIERTTAGLSEADKYEFFVARADRFWNARDYWNAATWYAQAMALRVDDPAVVHRAARSTIHAPGKATYTQDVQLAQSWVERALAKLAKQHGASVIDTARLHATLATTMWTLGKSSAAIAPVREALRMLAGENDAPAGQAYAVLVDAADALWSAGALPESAAAADRAVAAAEAAAGSKSAAASLAFASRARIRQARGDLAGAEEDIQKSITWFESQTPRDGRELAIHYASRASIRQDRGDHAGAEDDIKRGITWEESQAQPNQRELAIRYASRASIRRARGDLVGAEEDIQKSITWGESQSPRDERSLAIRYASRASIRQARGDLAGAEEDLNRSIAWYESQTPLDQRGVVFLYENKALLLAKQGRFAEAKAAIDQSVRLHTAVFGADHEWTKITIRRQQAIHAGTYPD